MIFKDAFNYNLTEVLDPNLVKARAAFVCSEIGAWRGSNEYSTMIASHSYYENRNDILDRVRTIAGEPTQKLANNKVAHPFLHKLVEQKVSYLLSEQPSVKVDAKETDDESKEDATEKKYQEFLETFFDERFNQRLQDCGRYACLNGLSWLQIFYDEDGEFDTKRIPSEQIIPYWSDTEHTKLDALIRFYELFNSSTKAVTLKAELWLTPGENEQGGVYFYEIVNGVATVDNTAGKDGSGYMAHYTIDGKDYNWDRLPFVPFKYNTFEMPLLKLIKSMNDAYDNLQSDNINDVEDVPNKLLIVKNYGGTDAKECRENIKEARIVTVTGEGGVDALNMEINGTVAENTLNRLKEDIYDFGCGVDQKKAAGTNQSGVALKFLYAGLDLDCKTMGQNFRAALQWVLWFYTNHLNNIGQGDFTEAKVKITFNTNMIVNQSEIIKDVQNSTGLLSEETLLENHPFVTDVSSEMDRIAKANPEAPDPAETKKIDLEL